MYPIHRTSNCEMLKFSELRFFPTERESRKKHRLKSDLVDNSLEGIVSVVFFSLVFASFTSRNVYE